MKIIEEFKTLQGEGKYLGVPSYFIRTTGCNLRCAWKNIDGTITKCDTPYTSWSPEKGKDFEPSIFLTKNRKEYFKHIVITGGEPLLQHDIADVVNALQKAHYNITIETNGTIFNKHIHNCFMSISPKTISSYMANGTQLRMHQINNKFMITVKQWIHSGNDYQIKFVFNNEEDLDEILRIQTALNIPSEKIYLMPQGITTEQFKEKEKELFNICMKYNFNYTPRMHIDIFGNKRGI